MRLPPRSEMRADSPALHAEQFRDPHQIELIPGLRLKTYANFPEEPQEEVSLSNRELQRFPENTVRIREEHQVQHGNSRNVRVHQIVSRSELIPCFRLKTYGNFIQSSQEEACLSNRELQRFPENTVRIREEHQVQHGNSRNGPCTPNRLQIRADSCFRLKTYGNFIQSSQEEASLSNRELQRFPENTVRIREEHQVQHGNSRNGPCTPNRLQIRADSCFRLKTYGNFIQSSQEEASLSNRELQRFPENTVRIREEHQVQHGNSRNGPCTPNRLQIRADSLL
uniref:Uncharacterized protein n=1 Tax=Rangifer tarandus platyrhynchus TaxID=3082113 RepID=A0ACB0EY66_RANTA|nr:unnamed protein product [Rangifer tarandus platyrhynchus]